jgi:hypothetical protein
VTQIRIFSPSKQIPPLDRQIQRHLLPLCEVLPETAAAALNAEIDHYLQKVQAALGQNEFLDVKLAHAIAARLRLLLPDYGRYPDNQKALLVGAVRYFTKDDDAEHDIHSVLGLDDDAAVVNYLLDVLGRPDLKIDL